MSSILPSRHASHTLMIMSETELKTERLQLLMEPSLRKAIKAWRFTNEIETEGEAVRRLIELGLQAEAQQSNAA
jgi:hypothetical protein